MRSMIIPAVALATAVVALPAQAASSSGQRHHPSHHVTYSGVLTHSGGFGTGPYWRGEPTDRRSIWRYGYYQGNDPDPAIRFDLMRDPTNHPSN